MEAGEGTRVPQSRLFGAPIRGCGVASLGFISEAASFVSIAPVYSLAPPCCLFITGYVDIFALPHLLVFAASGYLQSLIILVTLLLPLGSGSTPSGTTCALFKKFSKACSAESPTR